MGIWEIFLVGLGLSMDAVAVTIGNMMVCAPLSRRQRWAMPVAFGLFQGVMPLLGALGGSVFAGFISRFAGILAFVILGFIGGKMIFDGIKSRGGEEKKETVFTARMLLAQSVATSIDAFAVGVTFAASGTAPVPAAALIAAVTFCCTLLAQPLGKKFGALLGGWAQIGGGVILVLIGVKELF